MIRNPPKTQGHRYENTVSAFARNIEIAMQSWGGQQSMPSQQNINDASWLWRGHPSSVNVVNIYSKVITDICKFGQQKSPPTLQGHSPMLQGHSRDSFLWFMRYPLNCKHRIVTRLLALADSFGDIYDCITFIHGSDANIFSTRQSMHETNDIHFSVCTRPR
jgi:hypothetical protein